MLFRLLYRARIKYKVKWMDALRDITDVLQRLMALLDACAV
jgi:hypothetical protein